jgi:hypothetical protein
MTGPAPGSWAEAYAPRPRTYESVCTGGPADGQRHTLPAHRPPQARFYATPEARRGKSVVLARYVLHRMFTAGELTYNFAGTYERPGPVPGDKLNPAWS